MLMAIQFHQAFTGVAQTHTLGIGYLAVHQFNPGAIIAEFQ